MNVLGLSFDYHEAAAALLVNGQVAAAALEERFSRIKHDPALPSRAIAACLDRARLSAHDLDRVMFHETPLVKFDPILRGTLASFPRGNGFFRAALASWLRHRRFEVRERIAKGLGVDRAVKRTGIRNVCLAGGVAINSLANGRIIRDLGLPLYVHPAAGDAGGALGAAAYHYHHELGRPRTDPLTSACLGAAYDDEAIREAIAASGFTRVRTVGNDAELADTVARALADGMVIGWFQGRSEWGPRALGSRSILADPTRPGMQRAVNERIKFREPFRPFAPAVPVERATEFFDMPPRRGPGVRSISCWRSIGSVPTGATAFRRSPTSTARHGSRPWRGR